MKLRVVREILKSNPRGAQEVLDTVARHVRRVRACWTTHAELIRAAKVVIEEQNGRARKEMTLKAT